MKAIPLVDLERIHNPIRKEIAKVIDECITSSDFILGKYVKSFEEVFSEFCGASYGIGVASGTDALYLSLRAIDVGPGDTVITVANTFISTALAIHFTGATPFFSDVDENTFNLTKGTLESAIYRALKQNKRVKAIIPVHLYGRPCPMSEILTVAEQYNLTVVEDACQAHGSAIHDQKQGKNKKVGSFGITGCFSFYPGKNLGGFGDGGMIVTDNKEVAEKIRLLRNYGSITKYNHILKGVNSRLDSLQAAILSIKMKYISNWNKERAHLAQLYRDAFSSYSKLQDHIIVPHSSENGTHVYHLFVIRTANRNDLMKYLHSRQIFVGIHYPIPIHLQEAFKNLGYQKGDLPITEFIADEILSLPIFPGMTTDEISSVVEQIYNFYCK